MREWCSCGAAIHSLSHRAVKDWRANHFHDGKPEPEPDRNGSEAMTERRPQLDYDSPISYKASIGFQPNGFSPHANELRAEALKNPGC